MSRYRLGMVVAASGIVAVSCPDCPPLPCIGGTVPGTIVVRDDEVSLRVSGHEHHQGRSDWPMMDMCTTVTGSVWIAGSNTSYRVLEHLESVPGSIDIMEQGREDMDAFPRLVSTGYGIMVEGAHKRLSGFGKLETTAGLSIRGRRDSAETIDGFGELREVKYRMWIWGVSAQSINGFQRLERAAYLAVFDTLTEEIYFPALQEIKEDHGNTVSDGHLWFSEMSSARSINLPVLARVGGDFHLSSLPALTEVRVPQLREIGGKLHIETTGLEGMPGEWSPELAVQGGVTIRNNPNLDQAVAETWAAGIRMDGGLLVCGNRGGPVCPPEGGWQDGGFGP